MSVVLIQKGTRMYFQFDEHRRMISADKTGTYGKDFSSVISLQFGLFACCGFAEIHSTSLIKDTWCQEIFDYMKNNQFFYGWIDATMTEYVWTRFMKEHGAFPIHSFHNPRYTSGNLCTMWGWVSEKGAINYPKLQAYDGTEALSSKGPDKGKIASIEKYVNSLTYVPFTVNDGTSDPKTKPKAL